MKCRCCDNPLSKGRKKYCSKECIKRAWYLRNSSVNRHTILEGPGFSDATAKGLYWEIHAQNILGGRLTSLENMNRDCDLILDDGTRIDVKASNLFKRKMKRGRPIAADRQNGWWMFGRHKEKPMDGFFCICLIENVPIKYFLIPDSVFPRCGLSLSPASSRMKEFEVVL